MADITDLTAIGYTYIYIHILDKCTCMCIYIYIHVHVHIYIDDHICVYRADFEATLTELIVAIPLNLR